MSASAVAKDLHKKQNGLGMLWHDKSPLEEAVKLGAAHTSKRLGKAPNVCYINKTETSKKKFHGMKIIKVQWIRPNFYYFLIETDRQ